MSSQRFTPDFKNKAVRQIVGRGYSVTGVSERPGVSAHKLFERLQQPNRKQSVSVESRL